MKVWQKQKKEELGKVLFSWRYRTNNRFFTKIFTWLLGGFVTGILTSIVFSIIGLPEYSVKSARIAFFAVFVSGVTSAFFRNVYYGIEYRIMEKGIMQMNPLTGLKFKKAEAEGKNMNLRAEYILWEKIKEISEQEGALILNIKEKDEPLVIGVAPVASFYPASKEEAAGFPRLFKRNEKIDKEVLKKVVQKAREAKKAIQQ